MELIETCIPGVVIVQPRIFGDERGYFFESFSQRDFERQVCKTVFVQDNESKSCYGVVRGLHFQHSGELVVASLIHLQGSRSTICNVS